MPLREWAALLLGVVALTILLLGKRHESRLPPSPASDFLIGHARKIPLEYSWKTFSSWRKALGDVIYVHVLGNPMLIINSARVARDLFETRSANFSDRPYMPVIDDLMGMGSGLPFLPYGDRWRKQRRLMQRYFDPQGVQMFRKTQEEQVRIFMEELLAEPMDFAHSIERLASRLVVKVTYGYNATGKHDPLLERLAHVATLFTQFGEAGGSIIDIFPVLCHLSSKLPAWLPGVAIKRHALGVKKLLDEVKDIPMDGLLAERATGTAEPCFIGKVLDDYEEMFDQDPELKADVPIIGMLTFMAGFDTTMAAISSFFHSMTLYPEAMKRAQSEIDEMIGSNRLPTLEDRRNLPYLDCVVKEVYRMYPVTPIDLPHLSVDASEYEDWVIPARTSCVANIWEMMRDKDNFPDPEVFYPERHLDIVKGEVESGNLDKSALKDKDPSQILFGFGRRICPGRFYADANVWLTAAKVLAVFNIGPYTDPLTGEQIYPEATFQPFLVSGPKNFKCSISPRSPKHIELIRQEVQPYENIKEKHI